MRNTKLSLLLFFLTVTSVLFAQKEKKPNILILYADDLGWNDISSPLATLGNGSKNHETPNIDRLAQSGMSFTNAYAQQNCAPSRAALLTGQYAPVSGVYNVQSLARYGKGVTKENTRIIPPKQQGAISPKAVTFAETLKTAGYKSYIFGKVHGWHGDLTNDHGFDVDLSCSKKIKEDKASNYMAVQDADGKWVYSNPKYGNYATPYTEKYIREHLLPVANGNDPMSLVGTPKHFTDAITDVVLDELRSVPREQPFCMWVSFHAIHSAVVGRKDLNQKYGQRKKRDERHKFVEYAALTEHLDQSVGRILNELNALNLTENTLVIFTSDNGGVHGNHSNAPLRGAKGMFYEGGVRVPFIASLPGVIEKGATSGEPIHVIDMYPTLAEVGGADLPKPARHLINGESFAPVFTGKKETLKRDAIFWHFPGYMDFRQEPNTVMVQRVKNRWFKLRYSYEKETYELYNLSDDLSEAHNLLHTNEKKGADWLRARKMRELMIKWLKEVNPVKMKYKVNGEVVGLPVELAKASFPN